MTVREVLTTAALLRLPESVPKAEKKRAVEGLLSDLGEAKEKDKREKTGKNKRKRSAEWSCSKHIPPQVSAALSLRRGCAFPPLGAPCLRGKAVENTSGLMML
jgi:hypothetical protein